MINESLQQNFFNFVNSYRIEEVKKMLVDEVNSDRTILEIMYECGFNSKSSFNSVFKKQTGLTPSQYRVQIVRSKTA
ncbi:MAG: helix-turn-helix domain-containing protein [bacterium]